MLRLPETRPAFALWFTTHTATKRAKSKRATDARWHAMGLTLRPGPPFTSQQSFASSRTDE
eukprot:scaffold668298_cov60-Prasinocladus_malaysianus.AAC.1